MSTEDAADEEKPKVQQKLVKAPEGRAPNTRFLGKEATNERRRKVEELMLLSLTQREIAVKLGVSAATICRDANYILDLWTKEAVQTRDRYIRQRMKVYDRDERKIRGWIEQAPNLVMKGKLMLVLLKLDERRAKLIGADAPVRIQTDASVAVASSIAPVSTVDSLVQAREILANPAATEALMKLQDALSEQEEAEQAKTVEGVVVKTTEPVEEKREEARTEDPDPPLEPGAPRGRGSYDLEV